MTRRKRTELVSWEEELAQEAAKEAANVSLTGGGGIPRISTEGQQLSTDGGVLSEPQHVVIVDWILLNEHYEGAYDPMNTAPPSCFAVGREIGKQARGLQDEGPMAPPSFVPNPIADSCEECEYNQWGSGSGNAKLCGNKHRVLLASTDGIERAAKPEDLWTGIIHVPSTGLVLWRNTMKAAQTQGRPISSFICALSLVKPKAQASWKVPRFDLEHPLDRETYRVIQAARELHRSEFESPYSEETYAQPARQKAPPPKRRARR